MAIIPRSFMRRRDAADGKERESKNLVWRRRRFIVQVVNYKGEESRSAQWEVGPLRDRMVLGGGWGPESIRRGFLPENSIGAVVYTSLGNKDKMRPSPSGLECATYSWNSLSWRYCLSLSRRYIHNTRFPRRLMQQYLDLIRILLFLLSSDTLSSPPPYIVCSRISPRIAWIFRI